MDTGHGMCLRLAAAEGVRQGVHKLERWNDEELKALSARVVRAAPNQEAAHVMRALVLSGLSGAALGSAGPRSAAELMEAAAHFERSAALSSAPAVKAEKARIANRGHLPQSG